MNLSTSRLILRQWREADLNEFARLNDDPVVMEFMPRRLSRDESDAMADRIRTVMEERGWGLWAVEVKGAEGEAAEREAVAHGAEFAGTDDSQRARGPVTHVGGVPFIGYVGLSIPSFEAPFTPCVEVGWRLAKEHWGRGYASEAATASLRFAFEKLTLQQIVAFTVPLNKRSIRVMERIGMSRDPACDFEHPKLPPGDPLRSHILYRANRTHWPGSAV